MNVLFQLADTKLGGFVHPRAEGCAGIDLNQKLVLMLLRDRLPGGFDQDMVYGKGLKILLPVIDPVLVLCFRSLNGACSQIGK